jgi:hypothetical protein
MSLTSPRRYYLRQRLAYTRSQDLELAAVFRTKQEAIAWPDLPSDFPSRSQLMAAGYTTVRDLDGADVCELQGWPLYLSTAAARRVLAAMESWTMILTLLKSYTRQDGRNAAVYDAPLHASSARTVSGTGDTYEMGDLDTLRLKLDVTVVAGTGGPTLDVIVETSPDGVNEWQTVATFAQKSGVSNERNVFPGCDRFVRAKWTITGTNPSFTFSVTGEAC